MIQTIFVHRVTENQKKRQNRILKRLGREFWKGVERTIWFAYKSQLFIPKIKYYAVWKYRCTLTSAICLCRQSHRQSSSQYNPEKCRYRITKNLKQQTKFIGKRWIYTTIVNLETYLPVRFKYLWNFTESILKVYQVHSYWTSYCYQWIGMTIKFWN